MAFQTITPVGAVGPEENALLALRLFQPVGEGLVNAGNQRSALLQRLIETRNQQQFQNQYQANQQAGAVNLENLRSQNSQTLADKQHAQQQETNNSILERQLAVTKQQQDEIDKRDLQKQFSLNYPIYAQSAAIVGSKAQPLSSYSFDWNGLGQLQADMETVKTEATKKQQSAGAAGVLTILDQSTQQLKQALDARDSISKITTEDQSQARDMGLQALQTAALNGTIPGLDPKSDKYKTAVAALDKDQPDLTIASQLLGPSGIQAYATGVRQGLQSLANDKSRLARIASASRDVVAAQRGASENLTRLMSLTANNPQLGDALAQRNQTLNGLQSRADSTPTTPALDTQSIFNRLTTAPGVGGQQPPVINAPNVGVPNPTGDASLDAYNRAQVQQKVSAALQRLQTLRTQAAGQRVGLGLASNPAPYDPSQLVSGLAMGMGPSASSQASDLASTLSQQTQAQKDYDSLSNILGAGPVGGPGSGIPTAADTAPAFRLPQNTFLSNSALTDQLNNE